MIQHVHVEPDWTDGFKKELQDMKPGAYYQYTYLCIECGEEVLNKGQRPVKAKS